ncbi:MAG: hypothetical protein QM503_06585 [Bacteroidota bacterium]
MDAKLKTTATSITAVNANGTRVIMALKVFLKQIDIDTLIDLSKVVEKDPSIIKQAMQYKGMIGI